MGKLKTYIYGATDATPVSELNCQAAERGRLRHEQGYGSTPSSVNGLRTLHNDVQGWRARMLHNAALSVMVVLLLFGTPVRSFGR